MVKAIIYDYSKEPPELITLVGDDSQNGIFKALKKGARIELALAEDGFEPVVTGHYFKLKDDGGSTPTPTGVKYDSNIHGNMSNGIARFVTDREGNVNSDGFGFTVNASGKGGINCLGNGQFNIEPAEVGHRRLYIACCNYNARLEGEFMFLTNKVRNFSIKTRNRHQYRDEVDSNAPDSKVQGGLGIHFDIEKQEVGFKYEIVHGTNGGDIDIALPKNLEVGKWYGYKYTYQDASSSTVRVLVQLDYNDGQGFRTVMDKKPSVPSVFFNKADFDTWSQFWLRLNDEGKIANRNVRLFPL